MLGFYRQKTASSASALDRTSLREPIHLTGVRKTESGQVKLVAFDGRMAPDMVSEVRLGYKPRGSNPVCKWMSFIVQVIYPLRL